MIEDLDDIPDRNTDTPSIELVEVEKEISLKKNDLEKLNELNETLDEISDNVSETKIAKLELKEISDEFNSVFNEELEPTYLNNLDITYKFNESELKEINLKLSDAADFHTLMNM
jgi:hypothetical protein